MIREVISGSYEILRAMRVTLGYLFTKPITVQFPEEPVQIVRVVAQIVVSAGHDQQVKVPVGIDERIHHLHGHAGIDVVVHVPGHEQQLARQVRGLQ